jgi:hypothetical protein
MPELAWLLSTLKIRYKQNDADIYSGNKWYPERNSSPVFEPRFSREILLLVNLTL